MAANELAGGVATRAGDAVYRPASWILLAAALIISACGLVYELVAGALASYLIGDTLLRFSTVIGAYLFAMGMGAWLARGLQRNLLARFVEIEIGIGLFGGLSALILFGAFAWGLLFQPLLYLLVTIVGILVGLEIPLLLRLLRAHVHFDELVSRVLSLDYLGALAASLVFPLWFVPNLGLVRTGIAFGLINLVVALATLYLFRRELRGPRLWVMALVSIALLAVCFAYAERFSRHAEERLYKGEVIFSTQTPYQRVSLMRRGATTRLYLNGRLQFSSRDEYRYHEGLVHPAMASLKAPQSALVLGGGDGMAVRELLRYDSLREVVLVDIDHVVTELFAGNAQLRQLNGESLVDPRVKVHNEDAWQWLAQLGAGQRFDLIVMDLPDPGHYALSKFYIAPFLRLAMQHLQPQGLIVAQGTSPFIAREAFWCIVATAESAGLTATPYHVHVPSFGAWGFVMMGREPYVQPRALPAGLRFLTPEVLPGLFVFSPDMARVPVEPNRLDTQILTQYYERGWRSVFE
ncbi:MAG: polyamine aminopropyltransferase [Betaproteobacteria bacterium]|nr:polyamine aminopropyltransferase [Betaproteobacteria bacterium]